MEEEGGISSKQQFLIKLKIPKLEGVEEEEEDDDDLEEGEIKEDDIGSKDSKPPGPSPSSKSNPKRDNNSIRVCPECFKEFSSGKALGGHMRIHVQQQPPNPHKKNLHKLKPTQTTRFKKTDIQNSNPKLMEKQPQPYYMSSCVDGNGQPVCSLCGKNFPSIKSLFGHMRCHPEREWRGILPPDQSVVVHNTSINNNNNNNNHRKSSSSSSLSDDSPPRKTISYGDCADGVDDSAQDQEQEVFDLTQALPRWAVRAKRGRKAVVTPEISTSSQEDEEEEVQFRDAVEDLMRLAHGDQSFDESGLTHKQRVDEFEATNSNSLTNKADSASKKRKFNELKYVSPPSRMDRGKGKGKALMEMTAEKPVKLEYDDEYGGNYKHWSDNELSDSNEQLLINYKYSGNAKCESTNNGKVVMKKNSVISTTPNKKRRQKMKLMMDLESGLDVSPPAPPQAHQKHTPDKYKCSTCNKSFPTHQALGGHRSSHNKFKITILNAVEQEEDHEDHGNNVKLEEIVKESEPAVGAAAAVAVASGSTHQCKICNKIFPTGQALGGHKRCHWTGPADQAQSSQVTSSQTATVGVGDRKVLDFDLNEMPPPEDEAGGGYASSSSYNSNIG